MSNVKPRDFSSSLGSKIREFNLSSRKRNRCTRVFFFFIIYVSILTAEIFRGIFYMSEGWKRIEDSWKGISKVENPRVLLVAFLFYAWKHRRAPRMTSFASVESRRRLEENRKVFANFPSINNFLSDSKNHLQQLIYITFKKNSFKKSIEIYYQRIHASPRMKKFLFRIFSIHEIPNVSYTWKKRTAWTITKHVKRSG